jgi:HPr kinase/phosphorylase
MSDPKPVPLSGWAASVSGGRLYLNATGVAVDGRGVLLRGAPGSGKSRLALELIDRGGVLIADDGIWVEPGEAPALQRPDAAPDLIECRGVGLLRAGAVCGCAPLALAVDLDGAETCRLPPRRMVTAGGAVRPLILGARHPTLAIALMHMLRHGREEP